MTIIMPLILGVWSCFTSNPRTCKRVHACHLNRAEKQDEEEDGDGDNDDDGDTDDDDE